MFPSPDLIPSRPFQVLIGLDCVHGEALEKIISLDHRYPGPRALPRPDRQKEDKGD